VPKIWRFFDKADLFECYQCARCTGSCPAIMVSDKAIGPREILLRCLDLGHRAVVEDEGLWYCATCHVCEDRCPQKIPIGDLMVALRNAAARRDNVPVNVVRVLEMITKTGRAAITHQVNAMRAEYGLEALIEPDLDEIDQIIQRSGFKDVIRF
jgi:heterodisulfide reductase subunit C